MAAQQAVLDVEKQLKAAQKLAKIRTDSGGIADGASHLPPLARSLPAWRLCASIACSGLLELRSCLPSVSSSPPSCKMRD